MNSTEPASVMSNLGEEDLTQAMVLHSSSLQNPVFQDTHAEFSNEVYKLLSPNQPIQYNKLSAKYAVTLSKQSTESQPTSLETLPPEIRLMIWRCLLLNPQLGESSSFSRDTKWGRKAKFNLSPRMLLVCKQFHEEGMDVLYGENKFLIECISYPHDDKLNAFSDRLSLCPLLRYNTDTSRTQHPPLTEDSAAKFVRHWKVVVSMWRMSTEIKDRQLEKFCRLVSLHDPNSLEILVIPRGIESRWRIGDYHRLITDLLEPMSLFRNVEKVTFRDAAMNEIPDFSFSLTVSNPLPSFVTPSEQDLVSLTRLIQGNSECERLERMWPVFLAYAQSFERFDPFQASMVKNSKFSHDWQYLSTSKIKNHYLCGDRHPVEAALKEARTVMENDFFNISAFKKHRSKAVKFLERQYQNIKSASTNLVQFVKLHKINGYMFDPSSTVSKKEYVEEAKILLENYANSFERELDYETREGELDYETRVALRGIQKLPKSRFRTMPREIALNKCSMFCGAGDLKAFRKHFAEAVDDMDEQYFEIRVARSKLYRWDRKGGERDVQVESMLQQNSLIEWGKYEPDMRVKGPGGEIFS